MADNLECNEDFMLANTKHFGTGSTPTNCIRKHIFSVRSSSCTTPIPDRIDSPSTPFMSPSTKNVPLNNGYIRRINTPNKFEETQPHWFTTGPPSRSSSPSNFPRTGSGFTPDGFRTASPLCVGQSLNSGFADTSFEKNYMNFIVMDCNAIIDLRRHMGNNPKTVCFANYQPHFFF